MVTEAEYAPVIGIWDDDEEAAGLFTRYRVTATFTGRVMGGVPQKPDVIEGWLRTKMGVTDEEELAMILRRTLAELGKEPPAGATLGDLFAASEEIAAERNGNTFRRDGNGLYLAGYQFKAMLKENTNILYAGSRWGVTKKGPKSFLAERVFVEEDRIYLGRTEPDGTHLQLGQVSGPQGPRSTLTYYDYCTQPEIAFTVKSLNDCIEPQQWKAILTLAQDNGIGAIRSMGYGRFRVTGFDKL